MPDWLQKLQYDPFSPLLNGNDRAAAYFTRRDLLRQSVDPLDSLWQLPECSRIIKKQDPQGFWPYPAKDSSYHLVETFKQLRLLVELYQMDHSHPSVRAACSYIFSKQSPEGDIRGILANQMAAYYTGAILALLIKAGYTTDPRVEKGLQWLLEVRQSDGGWVELPGMLGIRDLTVNQKNLFVTDLSLPTACFFDVSQPFSIPATGMAIRPFCLIPAFRRRQETLQAAALLKRTFFKKNAYSTYQHPDNWTRFQYPYWWNNLVAALDSLGQAGIPSDDPDILKALEWLVDHQEPDGLWRLAYSSIHLSSPNSKTENDRLRVSLAICRVLKQFSD